MQHSKNLLYISGQYPNNFGDTAFIKTEIKYLSKEFDNIIVLSHGKKNNLILDVPHNVHIIFSKKWSHLMNYILTPFMLCQKSIISEMWILKQKKSLCLQKVKELLVFYGYALQESWQIKKIVKNFDISVCYSFWYWISTLGCILSKNRIGSSCRPICVTRTHGFDLYEFRTSGWQPFKRFMDKKLDGIFFISNQGKDYYLKTFACGPKKKYHLAYLGTDTPFVIKDYTTCCVTRIVSCSYINPVKRVPLIADAIFFAYRNGCKIEWTHIGGGIDFENISSYVQEKFEKKINFSFVGHKDNFEVLKYYDTHTFDLFINVSESEGLPVSMMEASSFGIPIIATDVGGVREIVGEDNGFLISKENCVKEAADAILRFSSLTLDEKKEMRRNARAKWENKFNAEKNYQKFAQELISLISMREK